MKTTISFPARLRMPILFLLALFSASVLFAGGPLKVARKNITYTFRGGSGTNGSAVVWVPSQNYYIAVIAGNADFPMEAFSTTGDPIWQGTTGIDLRGLWWNSGSSRIEVNTAGDDGWYYLKIRDRNAPDLDWTAIVEVADEPDYQSVLTRTPKYVVAYQNYYFRLYNPKNGKLKKNVELSGWDRDWEINSTSVAYTGNPSYPLALYDYGTGAIRFFDLEGRYLASTEMPEGSPRPEMFRFSFANGYAWLYDASERVWYSYDVFERMRISSASPHPVSRFTSGLF